LYHPLLVQRQDKCQHHRDKCGNDRWVLSHAIYLDLISAF
jgi:hypothetical protein